MFYFYTPQKTSENHRFSDVFRGYKNGTLASNGLNTVQLWRKKERMINNLFQVNDKYMYDNSTMSKVS